MLGLSTAPGCVCRSPGAQGGARCVLLYLHCVGLLIMQPVKVAKHVRVRHSIGEDESHRAQITERGEQECLADLEPSKSSSEALPEGGFIIYLLFQAVFCC